MTLLHYLPYKDRNLIYTETSYIDFKNNSPLYLSKERGICICYISIYVKYILYIHVPTYVLGKDRKSPKEKNQRLKYPLVWK